ncbi:MAG: hypothetical protein ACE366_02290 [Bradymonadia bacterium]
MSDRLWRQRAWVLAGFLAFGCTDDSPICEVNEDCYEGAVCTEDGRCLPESAVDGGRGSPTPGDQPPGNGGLGGTGGMTGDEPPVARVDGGAPPPDVVVPNEPDAGAVGGGDPGFSANCVEACETLTFCALNDPELCSGVYDQARAGQLNAECLPLCEQNPALAALVNPDDCSGTLLTLTNVSSDFDFACSGAYFPSPNVPGGFPSVCGLDGRMFRRAYILSVTFSLLPGVPFYMAAFLEEDRPAFLTLVPVDNQSGELLFDFTTDTELELRWDGALIFTARDWYLPPEFVPDVFGGTDLFIEEMSFEARSCNPNGFCGDLTGSVIEPFGASVEGSIFTGAEFPVDEPIVNLGLPFLQPCPDETP